MTKTRTVIAAVVAALVATAFTAAPSEAEEYRIGFKVTVSGSGTGTIGTLEPRANSNGNRVICVSSGLGNGQVKAGVEKYDPELAWLLHRFINNTSSNIYAAALAWITKDKLDNQPGFWAKEKAVFQQGHSVSYTMTQDAIADMKGQAALKRGPYTIPLAKADVANEPLLGEVTNVGILAAGGAWMTVYDLGRWTGSSTPPANAAITLRITGGTFVANGETTMTVTPDSAPQTVRIRSDGVTERAQVTASVEKVLPSTNYLSLSPQQAGNQMMVTPVTALSATTSETVEFRFWRQPVLSSKVATAYVPLGGKLKDTVRVEQGEPGSEIAVSAKVWGPLPAQPSAPGAVPEGVGVFQEFPATRVRLDEAGAGEVSFASEKTAATGWYVWQESADSGDGNLAANSTFGRPEETAVVQQPKVTTRATQAKVQVGEQISDNLTIEGMGTVAGGVDAVTRTGTIAVLGPLPAPRGQPEGRECAAIPAADWAKLKPAKTWPFTESQNQTYPGLGQYTVPKSGCYAFTAELTGKNQAGETVYHVTHKPGDDGYAGQLVLADVEEGLWSQVGASIITSADGDVLTDEIVLVGREDLDEAFIGARVYGPFGSRPSQAAKPGPAPDPSMLYAVVGPVRVAVDSDGSAKATLSMPRPAQPGVYVWQEYAASAVADDLTRPVMTSGEPLLTVPEQALDSEGNPLWLRRPGQALDADGNLLWVTAPEPAKDADGNPLWAVPPQQATDADGEPMSDPVTHEPVLAGGEPLWTPGEPKLVEPVPLLTDPVQATDSDGVLLWAPGTRTQSVVGGSPQWEPKTVGETQSVFGRPSELVLVAEPPSVRSTMSAQSAEIGYLGDTLSDTIQLTGVNQFLAFSTAARVEIEGQLWGPAPAVDGSCAGADWTDAPVASKYAKTVTGDGAIPGLGAVIATSPGCYAAVATITGWNGSTQVWRLVHQPGSDGYVDQTVRVVAPGMATQVNLADAEVGQALIDTISVTRFPESGAPTGTKITASLRGPLAPADSDGCDTITAELWADAIEADEGDLLAGDRQTVPVAGNGQVQTAPVVVGRPGCYTWTEDLWLPVDPERPVASTPPGEVAETTLVALPQVLTRTSHQLALPGAAIVDTIRVTQLADSIPAVIDATLYGPYLVRDGRLCVELTEADWDRAIADEIAHSDTDRILDVQSGEHQTRPVEVSQAGCYTWVEVLRVGPDPDEPDFVVRTPPGLAAETTLVRDGESLRIETGVPGLSGVPDQLVSAESPPAIRAVLVRSRRARKVGDE